MLKTFKSFEKNESGKIEKCSIKNSTWLCHYDEICIFIVLFFVVFYCIVLYCFVLFCIVLYKKKQI